MRILGEVEVLAVDGRVSADQRQIGLPSVSFRGVEVDLGGFSSAFTRSLLSQEPWVQVIMRDLLGLVEWDVLVLFGILKDLINELILIVVIIIIDLLVSVLEDDRANSY